MTTTPAKTYSQSLLDFLAMARRADYLILDTETTGLHDGEVVSIAIINAAGETLLNTLVKPSKPIPEDATKIHGITNEMVKDAPTWDKVAAVVELILDEQTVIVYNSDYDRMILANSNRLANVSALDWYATCTWHCAMAAFAEVYGDWNDYRQSYKWQKLTTAAKHYNLNTNGAHGALADCLMTWGVVKGMCEAIGVEG